MDKKILVISHNALKLNSSNGRTLAKMLNGFKKENIAQFYITNEAPDFSLASKFYRVTDVDALRSIYDRRITVDGIVDDGMDQKANDNKANIHKRAKNRNGRTPLKYFIRNIVWDLRKWKNNSFDRWLSAFNPDMIFLQVSDCTFILKFALDVSKKYNIPIFVYNSEDYYFKENYRYNMLHKFNSFYYKKTFNELMRLTKFSFYSCEKLLNTYKRTFPNINGKAIYTASDLIVHSKNSKDEYKYFMTYAGNLGLNRHKALIDLSKKIQASKNKFDIDVFGKIDDENAIEELRQCIGINYHGFVDYSEIIEVLINSNTLLHVEDFSDFTIKDLKHGFSTKVSDALSLGKPFIVYAPRELAISEFVIENKCGFWISQEYDMDEFVDSLEANRSQYSTNALNISGEYFNQGKNDQMIIRILNDYI